MTETSTPGSNGTYAGRHHRAPDRGVASGAQLGPAWRRAVTENMSTLATLIGEPAGRPLTPLPGPEASLDAWRKAVAANLASLNDVTVEIAGRVAEDPGFAGLVLEVLRDHTWAVGYEFRGQRPPGDWAPPWAR